MIDIEQALNALEEAVSRHGRETDREPLYYSWEGMRCIVGESLSILGVSDDALWYLDNDIQKNTVDSLYEDDQLPIPMTLGAMLVFRAAQREQDLEGNWGEALDAAVVAAGRVFDLMPDSLIADQVLVSA